MISNLYCKSLYTMPVDFIITPIYEYDISKANISILLSKGVITKEQHKKFCEMSKQERQVKVGLMMRRNPDLIRVVEDGCCEARRNFVVSNDIQDDEIVSIRKDSLFITKQVENVAFGDIRFVHKNTYSLMAKLGNLELYYYYDSISGFYNIDVKGIRDELLVKHESSLLTALCDIFYCVVDKRIHDAVKYVSTLANKYDTLNLPIEYYREFNQSSLYRIMTNIGSVYYIDEVTPEVIGCIDIRYNKQVMRDLVKLITKIYITSVSRRK